MIPKIIHYCWFGGKPFSPLAEECVKTWNRHVPEYEIKRWDETNSPLDANPYIREAFQCRQWAFVSDYVRFHALAEEGGIYLDTDMYLCRSLDPLREHRCFLGFEDSRHINSLNSAIIGAVPEHRLIRDCLHYYARSVFNETRPETVLRVVSPIIRSYGTVLPGVRQRIDDIELYPPSFFYPWPSEGYKQDTDFRKYMTRDSYTVHLWNKSWKTEFDFFREGRFLDGLSLVVGKLKRNPFRPVSYYWRLATYAARMPWFSLLATLKRKPKTTSEADDASSDAVESPPSPFTRR